MKKMKTLNIPTEKKWYLCSGCGQKLLIYNDTAECHGVYIRCKYCHKTEEIKIQKH